MRPIRSLIVLAALLCLGTAATAQAPAVKLRHQRKMADRWERSESANFSLVFSVLGQTSDGTLSSDVLSKYEVVALENGHPRVRRTGTETTRIMGIPNAPEEEKEERTPAEFVQEASGKPVRTDFPPLELNQELLMNFGRLLSYETDQIPPLEVFPDKDAAVGEEWSHTHTVKTIDGKERKLTVKSRLFSFNEASGEAWIVSESTTPTEIQLGPELGALKATGSMTVRQTFLFNAKEGKTVRGHAVANGEYHLQIDAGGMQIPISMTLSGTIAMTQQ